MCKFDYSHGCDCRKCVAFRNSKVFVFVLSTAGVTVIDPLAIGLAVTLGKPIVLAFTPGFQVPDKLAKIVDRFVEVGKDDSLEQILQSIKETLVDMGEINV